MIKRLLILVLAMLARPAPALTLGTGLDPYGNACDTVQWSDGQTYPVIVVDVTADSHPYWTGERRVMDTEGRVEKFRRRYERFRGGAA